MTVIQCPSWETSPRRRGRWCVKNREVDPAPGPVEGHQATVLSTGESRNSESSG
jgi:hypothetical protein